MRFTLYFGLLVLVACAPAAASTHVSGAQSPDRAAVADPSPGTGKGKLSPPIETGQVRSVLAASKLDVPVLLPTWLPASDLQARVSLDRGFQVFYWRRGATMWSVAVGVGGGPDPVRMLEKPNRSFRGAPAIYLLGNDRPDHITLEWDETTANGPVGYTLSAYGLTEEDFARLTASVSDH
jgi:hypothetical protein